MKYNKLIYLIITLTMVLACVQTTPEPAQDTQITLEGSEIVATPVFTRTPTASSSTQIKKLFFTFDVNTNCRQGPSQIYGILATILPGNSAEVIGRNEKNTWLFVAYEPENVDCWVSIITGTLEERTMMDTSNTVEDQSPISVQDIQVHLSPIAVMPTLTPWPKPSKKPTHDDLFEPHAPSSSPPPHSTTATPRPPIGTP